MIFFLISWSIAPLTTFLVLPEQTKSFKKRLQREVNLSATVDKALLGGVIIRTEDTVIDNSVRGKLQKLAQVLG